MDKCVETSDHLKTDRDFSVSYLYNACFSFPLFKETLSISGSNNPKIFVKY